MLKKPVEITMQVTNVLMVSFVCIVLMTAVVATGCTSTPGEGLPQGPGISDITPRDDVRQVSLKEALDALKAADINGTNNQSALHIYYIRGESLDVNGTAKAWAIGAERSSKGFFFIYDAKGTQITDWPGGFPGPEIDTSQIMSPGDLFKAHRLLMQDITDNWKNDIPEIDLQGGIYTITVRSNDEMKDYVFDALTGKQIIG